MECIYAALLLHKIGKPIDEQGIHKVLETAGAHVDEAKIKTLIASLKGVDIESALKEAPMFAAAPAGAASGAGSKGEEKKEEEKKEEAAIEGLSALFG